MSFGVSFPFDRIRRLVADRLVQAARIAPGASEVGNGLPSFALVDRRDSRAALDAASVPAIRDPVGVDSFLCLAAPLGVYGQRIQDEVALGRSAMSDVHRWHDPDGDAMQLSAVDIDRDRRNPACGGPLLECMLPRACLQRGVHKIVAVTLYSDFTADFGTGSQPCLMAVRDFCPDRRASVRRASVHASFHAFAPAPALRPGRRRRCRRADRGDGADPRAFPEDRRRAPFGAGASGPGHARDGKSRIRAGLDTSNGYPGDAVIAS